MTIHAWRAAIWQQFGAAIDALDNAIVACRDELWNDRTQQPEFWYVAYHTLFFLDLYLSGSPEGFAPPPPFTRDEMEPDGQMPEPFTKAELREYLRHGREKCSSVIDALTDEEAIRASRFPWLELPIGELLLYNMRHVQHHTGQLNLILRQQLDLPSPWVRRARTAARSDA